MKDFDTIQNKHWSKIRQQRFTWQTEHPFVSQQERKLLSIFNKIKGNTLLEVGCGEGPNLINVTKKCAKYGIDYSAALVEFAQKNLPHATISNQDATNLDFPDNMFDIVFCRDLLHHVRNRNRVISEMHRVCKPRGSIVLIESNGLNPLIFIFSLIHPAEQDVKFITPQYLKSLLKQYQISSWNYAEPSSVWRVIFHYKYGIPSLAKYPIVQKIYSIFDRLMHLVIPKKMWGYMIIQLRK